MASVLGYKREFPDFETLPDNIQSFLTKHGFVDFSWHNDAMPYFLNEKLNLGIWIDYPTFEQSEWYNPMLASESVENQETKSKWRRYYIGGTDSEGMIDETLPNLMTNDFVEVIKFIKGHENG